MSNVADKWPYKKDAQLSFAGGVNAAVPPHTIGKDQVVAAVNATMRGGRCKPRSGYALKELSFSALTTAQFVIPAAGATVNVSVDEFYGGNTAYTEVTIGGYVFTLTAINTSTSITVQNDVALNAGTVVASGSVVDYTGDLDAYKFQGAGFYDGNGIPALISSHGGRIWRIDLRTWKVSEITPASGRNSALKDIIWTVQAENYFIVQDNESLPIIYDGTTARRSVPASKEVPVGNVMAYAHGRLIVSLPDRTTYRVGDLVFGSSGTAALDYRDAVLKFTENDYYNEGGDFTTRVFGANSVYGTIRSMTPIAMTNTQLGQGPVMIGQPNMVFTVQLPFDRTAWKNLASPLQTTSPINGPLGQRSTILNNGDIWYRAIDGIRSYVMALRDFSSWGNTPMSGEIHDTLSYDTDWLLEYGSACLYDNRLLCTVSPVKSDMGIWHRGLAVMDFNLINTVRGKLSPAWEGVWTGQRILQILSCIVDGKERCFMYCLSDSGTVQLWEIDKNLKEDHDNTRISWSVDMRSMDFGNIEQFKNLQTARLSVRNLSGILDITAEYKSDQAPCWQAWDTAQVCAANSDCGPTWVCAGPSVYREQKRDNIRLRLPPDGFDTISGWKYRTGYEFQPRLELVGYAEIERLIVYSVDEPENLSAETIV